MGLHSAATYCQLGESTASSVFLPGPQMPTSPRSQASQVVWDAPLPSLPLPQAVLFAALSNCLCTSAPLPLTPCLLGIGDYEKIYIYVYIYIRSKCSYNL